MTIKAVSSPARVPTIISRFMESMAEQAAEARAGMVFITTIFCHHNILRIVTGHHALAENGMELGRGVALQLLGHGAVAIASVLSQLLDDPQFLDIPGNGRLGRGKAAGLQLLQELLLGLDILGLDQLENFGLSVRSRIFACLFGFMVQLLWRYKTCC